MRRTTLSQARGDPDLLSLFFVPFPGQAVMMSWGRMARLCPAVVPAGSRPPCRPELSQHRLWVCALDYADVLGPPELRGAAFINRHAVLLYGVR